MRSFVFGKTEAKGTEQGGLVGFEDSAGVDVKKGTQAAELPGKIVFEASPASPKAGERFKVSVFLSNEGSQAIQLAAMTVATVLDGKRQSGPVPLSVTTVAPGQRAPRLPDAGRAGLEGGHAVLDDGDRPAHGQGRHLPQRSLLEVASWASWKRSRPSGKMRRSEGLMRNALAPALVLLLLPAALARGDDPPAVEHQPAPCTVPEKPLSLCAAISDDGNVATARLYFRREGEDYYAFVNMAFTGVSYCGTVPGPREKAKGIEYYVQAVDDNYQPTRTSTYRIAVQPEGVCEFPPAREGCGQGGGHQGDRDEPQAGEEARRRLQPDRRHVCPPAVGSPAWLSASSQRPRPLARRPYSTSRGPSCPSPRASRCASW